MSILISAVEADFVFLKEKTKASSGNLSVQIEKLKEAGYIEVIKEFADRKPRTLCRITPIGRNAFEEYIDVLKDYLHP